VAGRAHRQRQQRMLDVVLEDQRLIRHRHKLMRPCPHPDPFSRARQCRKDI
jgi:hypothetical protein